MKQEQVNEYFSVADKLADVFYFKVWKQTEIPFDKIKLSDSGYAPLNNWQEIFRRECYVPSDFFEAMYKMS